MSALQRQPKNPNLLSSTGYRFHIERIPNVNFFCQGINIPGKKIEMSQQSTPLASINLIGNHLKHNDLTVTFKVDEDLQNFLEIYNWLDAAGHPESLENTRQYLNIYDNMYSDCMVTIMDNNKNTNIRMQIINAFPLSISDLIFSSTNTDESHLVATAIFKYERLKIERLERNVN
jgi:hypothetical protein